MDNELPQSAARYPNFNIDVSRYPGHVEFTYIGREAGVIGTLVISVDDPQLADMVLADKPVPMAELAAVVAHAETQVKAYEKRKSDTDNMAQSMSILTDALQSALFGK